MTDPVLVAGSGGQYSIGLPGGGPAFVYGNGAGSLNVQDTQTDTGTLNVQDQPIVGQDGLQFGVDTLPGMIITQTGFAYAPHAQATALDAYSALAGAWNDPTVRLVNGAIQVLRAQYPYSNVTRRCYGRGRKIIPTYGQVNQGVVPWVAQFQAADNTWYEDVLSSVTITQAPAFQGGGMVPPVTPPVNVMQSSGVNQNAATNTGSLPTWPVFTFTGPTSGKIQNPGLLYVNSPLNIGLNGVLHPGDVFVIDTRPWARSALLNGQGVGGSLTGSPMLSMQLPPGTTLIQMIGADFTGTAQLTVSWRNATLAIGGTA